MPRPQQLRILLVDDDETTLTVLAASLEAAGHDVLSRSAALGTTVTIGREHPDVVVLDVCMPGLTGDRLASLIAEQGGSRPPFVILHSSLPQADLDELVKRSGAGAAIEKAANPAEFVRRLHEVLPLSRRLQRATG